MAVIGFDGFGPLPMYDVGYAERIRQIKRQRGIYPTLLDRKAAAFKNAFRHEGEFEVLHFLPLYLLSLDPTEFLKAVRAIARGDPEVSAARDPATRKAVAAVASVLSGRRQRELLADFVDALEEERRVFYDSYDSETYPLRRLQTARAERHWNAKLAPALASYLERTDVGKGLIVASPAVGAEGRFVRIGGGNSQETILAVGLPLAAGNDDAISISAVRELCFPLVHRVINGLVRRESDRVSEERLSSVAAVRCGSLVLERYAPELTTSYQSQFLRAIGPVPPEEKIDATFARAFALQPAIEVSLRRAIASL